VVRWHDADSKNEVKAFGTEKVNVLPISDNLHALLVSFFKVFFIMY
jgi:hypothetical protein